MKIYPETWWTLATLGLMTIGIVIDYFNDKHHMPLKWQATVIGLFMILTLCMVGETGNVHRETLTKEHAKTAQQMNKDDNKTDADNDQDDDDENNDNIAHDDNNI